MKPLLSFIHVSDTHLGITGDYILVDGHMPRPFAEQFVLEVNAMPQLPDFIIHGGDIIDDWQPSSYLLARTIFERIKAPTYYVCGNHDKRPLVHEYFPIETCCEEAYCYRFTLKGEQFLVLDTSIDAIHGHLSDEQLARVRDVCADADGPPLTIFMHHPPFLINSPWADANMFLDNGQALHEALLPARDRLRGVFCGHTHRNMHYTRDGITYSVVTAAQASQFCWMPWDERVCVDPVARPGYNYVQYFPGYVTVMQCFFQI